jgi:hypothetical protein
MNRALEGKAVIVTGVARVSGGRRRLRALQQERASL